MASGKGILLGALGGLVLRDATVRAVRDVAPHFRAVELVGPALRGVDFHPGDKIQVLLPSRDVRTYTPLRWDSEAGATELLVYHHTDSPAGAWIRARPRSPPGRRETARAARATRGARARRAAPGWRAPRPTGPASGRPRRRRAPSRASR